MSLLPLPERPPTVVVCEDEVLVRMLVADVLEEAGMIVLEATTAVEAMRFLDERPQPDAMLADIDLPGGVDGVALAHRAAERCPGLAIVLTSGRNRPVAAELPRGVTFLPKPFTNPDLLMAVRAAVVRTRAEPGLWPADAIPVEVRLG